MTHLSMPQPSSRCMIEADMMLLQPLATAPAMWTRTQLCAPMRRRLVTLKNVSAWGAALPDHALLNVPHEDSLRCCLTPPLPGCQAARCAAAVQLCRTQPGMQHTSS